MGLDLPELDDREYEELVDEAQKLIPAYSEEWTDHNPHDPGVTIIETLAWVTETYIYQLDRVTDEHRDKYLKLMGERRRRPQPATAQLSLGLPATATAGTVPAGTQLMALDGPDGREVFETDHDAVLTAADVEAVVAEHSDTTADHTHANETAEMSYRVFGDDPTPGDALYLGFDGDPFGGVDRFALNVAFHDDDLPAPATHGDEESTFEPSVELVWEYCTDYVNWRHDEAWAPLSVLTDETDSFYGGGKVVLDRPDDWRPSEWETGTVSVQGGAPGLVWLRCRVRSGGYEIPPQFDAVRTNVVSASHRSVVHGETLSRARRDSDPEDLIDQTYVFENAPVLEADVTVDGERWTEVDDFDASGPTDTHYVLDSTAGEVHFGDGIRGDRPDPGQTVAAEQYVYGGGDAGNVPASSTWQFVDDEVPVSQSATLSDVSVSPLGPAEGGADAETIEEAFKRVRQDLKRPYRAVTHDDYEYLATHTPGLRFGRAAVFVDTDDEGRDQPQVNVVIVPYAPPDVARPVPSEGFRTAVREHLETHRLLTDRIAVEQPTYVGVDVSVDLRTSQSTVRPGRASEVESRIEAFLDPLRGYEGDGWPFGRALYNADLHDLLADVEWVDHVRDVSVSVRGDGRIDTEGNVLIGDTALFYVADVSVDIQSRSLVGAVTATAEDETESESESLGIADEQEENLDDTEFEWGQ